jgi:tetratricopeptide (TPR) repeat protein
VDRDLANLRRKAPRRTKLAVVFVAMSLVAAACGGGGGEEAVKIAEDFRNKDADDVQPPERVDSGALANPGLILWSNSRTWQRLLSAPEGDGVVVLFVQPGSPSNEKGIARGDLLTAVDGTKVTNHEHAIALLRASQGDKRKLTFKSRDGEEREVEITPELPKQRARPFINALLKESPNDAVLHFLRATSVGGNNASNMEDLERAIEIDSRFVEAMSERASIRWLQRLGTEEDDARRIATEALAGWENALDIDPRNPLILSVRAAALVDIGQAQKGKAEVEKALDIDGSQPQALFTLARAEFRLDRPQQAAGPAAGAIALNPYTNLFYYRLLERIFLDLKRPDDCKATAASVRPYLEAHKSKPFTDAAKALTDLCE